MEGNIPCIRCMLEKDPLVQKYAARIKQLRGSYDRYGNRIPPSFFKDKKAKRWKKRSSSLEKELLGSDDEEESRANRRSRSSRRTCRPKVPRNSITNPTFSLELVPPGSNVHSRGSPDHQSGSSYIKTSYNIRHRPARSSPVQELDEESSEDGIPVLEVDVEEATSSMETSEEESSESEKAQKSKSPVTRTMLKVEVKHKLEESYKEGVDASQELIKADQNLEEMESEENDTVNEAPSIEDDEMPSKSDEASNSEESYSSSNKWNTAENIKILINVHHKLQEATREGKEVSEIILEAQHIMEKLEKDEAKKSRRFNFFRKMSQFQALAMIGRLLLGIRNIKDKTKVNKKEELPNKSDTEITATGETEDETIPAERDLDPIQNDSGGEIHDTTQSNLMTEMESKTSSGDMPELESFERTLEDKKSKNSSSSSDEESEASETEESVTESVEVTNKISLIQIQVESQHSLKTSSPNTLQVPGNNKEEMETLPKPVIQNVTDSSESREVSPKQPKPKTITHFQALILLQRLFAAKRKEIRGGKRNDLKSENSVESEGEASSEEEHDLASLSESKDESESLSGSESESRTGPTSESMSENSNCKKDPLPGEQILETSSEEKDRKETFDEPKEEEVAATRIQSNFRGMQARKNVEKIRNEHENVQTTKEEKQRILLSKSDSSFDESSDSSESSFSTSSSEEEISEDEEKQRVERSASRNYSKKEEKAVTVIQSGYRGMKARKRVKNIKEDKAVVKIQSGYRGTKARRKVEVIRQDKKQNNKTEYHEEEAVTKIQSGYRGMKARRRVHRMKQGKEAKHEFLGEEEFEETDENVKAATKNKKASSELVGFTLDDDMEDAAVKIQANFKGMKTRKELQVKPIVPTSNLKASKQQADHLFSEGCENKNKEIANYDSTNDFTEDSDSDSSSDDSSATGSGVTSSSAGTNDSVIVRNVLLREQLNDWGSVSNQNTPRHSVDNVSPVHTPINAHVVQVEPIPNVEDKEVASSFQNLEISQSFGSTPGNEEKKSEQSDGQVESRNGDLSSLSGSESSSSTTNSSFSTQIRSRKSPFALLKQLVSIFHIPAKVERNNRIGINNGAPKPADVTKSKPLFLPGESMESKSSVHSSDNEHDGSSEDQGSTDEDGSESDEEQII